MAKTKISEYSSTASNNTDVDGINIAEGMAPSNVNNAMREIMAHLKDWQAGNVAQDMKVDGAFTCTGNVVMSADASVGDDLTVTGDATVGGGFTCTGAAVLSSTLAVTSNATVGGTLSATGATSLGAATFSGAVVMSSTLAAKGNVTMGNSTSNAHVMNGNLTLGASTTNTVTLGALLSSGGGTGTSGQFLKSRGTSNTPVWDDVVNNVKAWVNFDGSTAANVTGTYTNTATTVTVTINNHGLIAGNVIYADVTATTGTAADGTYTVASVVDANTFTYANTATAGGGNITLLRRAIRGSSNVGSVTYNNSTGQFYINFSTAISDANYCVNVTASSDTVGFSNECIGTIATAPTAQAVGIGFETGGGGARNPVYGFVTVIR